jgi:DeoR/GlpR family transcriptional regulator of sugar metabolism
MKTREQRLEAILELVRRGPPGGTARETIYRRMVTEHGVSLRTIREDLQDLEVRGMIAWRAGFVVSTAKGKRRHLEGF